MTEDLLEVNIKRLLFTGEPYVDESFTGYLMRLADLNEIPGIQWILQCVISTTNKHQYDHRVDFDVLLDNLSKLVGVKNEQLRKILYVHAHWRGERILGDTLIFGVAISPVYIRREAPKLCPQCLSKRGYCQKVWELAPITVCPEHGCLLIDQCPKCAGSILWSRRRFNFCSCGFDFRLAKIDRLRLDERRLAIHLYKLFGIPIRCKDTSLDSPLLDLSCNDLLNVLFFFSAHFDQSRNPIGTGLIKYKNNAELHALLSRSVRVFDDWPHSYYELIRDWRKREKNFFISCKQLYDSKSQLPRQYAEYEMFSQILNHRFSGEQFDFLRTDFRIYLNALERAQYWNE
jgi:TniQ